MFNQIKDFLFIYTNNYYNKNFPTEEIHRKVLTFLIIAVIISYVLKQIIM